ncbi:Hypothetical predicted protein, partial [Cloeon dipterum]
MSLQPHQHQLCIGITLTAVLRSLFARKFVVRQSRIKDGPVLGSFVKQPHSSAPARGESDMVANGNSVTPMDDGAGEDNPGRR